MLRFYLLRHAKSSWAEPGRPDSERGLNARGNEDLPKIAEAMRQKEYLPKHVFCSPSLRTRLTLHGIMSAFSRPPTVDYVEELYSGGVPGYFECLRAHVKPESVMIIGHNPMCEAFSMVLAGSGADGPLAEMKTKFPTGALAVFDIDATKWAQTEPGSGHLVDFVMPREL